MAKTKTESERDGKVNLSDLTNIPAKEFEKHFRDWMERDDVARSLQAKLRTDLIANFNKTALGKHILAQTTTTTGGGITQRLTLCPLTLALNTLVAEFLYAENCHFTLSVFCTEVPFRNTLPDFESMRQFRFNEQEISEVVIAVAGDLAKTEKRLITDITHKYAVEGGVGGSGSLLLFIIKVLLERIQREARKLPIPTEPKSKPTETPNQPTGDSKEAQHEFKTEVYNSNFRYLNKYLIILSKKVNEMTQHFKSLQQITERSSMRPRILKTKQTRKFENLNRSLDRITENLKLMSHAKRRSKHVGAIVSAIEGLALQFTKCAANFENVSRGLSGKSGGGGGGIAKANVGPRVTRVEKQTETEAAAVVEKSYMDWVQEMRHTSNGQKFLDRIELALRKALNKQRDQLNNETDMKLRHQKELLKIRYKQKLMEELSKHGSTEHSLETRKINENIERKLQLFEQKHFELLHKIHETEAEVKKLPHKTVLQVEKITEEPKVVSVVPTAAATVPPATSRKPIAKTTKPILKDAMNTQKQLQQIVNNMTLQERTVDHIVFDAKLRIQELENESNQLEQSFLNYLERQRMEKEATNKAAAKLWDYYATERDKMWQRFKGGGAAHKNSTNVRNSKGAEVESEDDLLPERKQLKQLHVQQNDFPLSKEKIASDQLPIVEIECRNAILEAKETFFENKRRCMEHVERQFEFISLPNDVEEFANTETNAVQLQSIQTPAATRDYQRFLEQTKTKAIAHDFKLQTIKEKAADGKSHHKGQTAEVHHAQARSIENVKQSKPTHNASNVVKLVPENFTKRTTTTTTAKNLLDHKETTLDDVSATTTSKSTTVLKQSMAKMQLLFNDSLAKGDGNEKEQSNSTINTNSIKKQTSSQVATEPFHSMADENPVEATNSTLPGISTMLNSTMTESATPSITSVNTTTESTSTEQQLQSMLEVSRLPQVNVKVPELPELALSSDGSVGQIESSNTNDSASGGATSIEVAAVLHANKKQDEVPSGTEMDEVADETDEKLTATTIDSQEVGEVLEQNDKVSPLTPFTAMEQKLQASSSDESSIELQLSLGGQRKENESESDFWA